MAKRPIGMSAVRMIPLKQDVPILDVCTGTGDLAIAYWKRGRGAVPVIGSDFTHQARKNACAESIVDQTRDALIDHKNSRINMIAI